MAAAQIQQRRSRDGARRALGVAAAAAWLFILGCSMRDAKEMSSSVESSAIAQVGFPGSMQRKVGKVLQDSFPGAMSGPAMFAKVLKATKPYGLTPKNVMYGQSICSDEINNEKSHISTLLTNYYGKVFPMGGIGGAPYVGKTGFGAFSAHTPANGHVVVLFGPHIGFSPDGEAGKFLRIGQGKPSTACGAAIAAYSQCTSGKTMPADAQDMEQSWLRQKLGPYCAGISKSENPQIEIALKAYKAIEEEVLAIVNTKFGPGNLVLIGGIQVNMPYPMQGHFLPLHFSIRSAGMAPKDLMSALA